MDVDANNKLSFNVNDPLIKITGAVTGQATMTNLGDVTINVSGGDDTVGSSQLDSVKTFTIYDVSGGTLFTMYGAGA